MKLFDSVSLRRPKLNKFDLSHERKMTCAMGKLIPSLMQEIVPGDRFRVRTEMMLRLVPLLAPIMHRVDVTMHFFYVPTRLLWNEWEDFITGGRLGTTEPVWPHLKMNYDNLGLFQESSLADYLGLPMLSNSTDEELTISALPFRAYQLIWDTYYRDQNLAASLDISKASGEVTGTELDKIAALRTRAWEKDYFTSCLPWAQRGDTVDIPLNDDPTVQTKAYRPSTGLPFSEAGDMTIGNTGNVLMTGSATQDGGVHIGAEGHGIDVNDLRRSIRLQEWLEKNARGGARYIEQILSHFGVMSSDARLQRPEYLGGGKQPVTVSEVLSTYQVEDPTPLPQGYLTGKGVSFGTSNQFSRRFEEHGFVIGLLSVLPRTGYQQGVPRTFRRSDKLDYYWPEFANIGEQEVKVSELFFNGENAGHSATFGYQSRYAEYKYQPSTVHGQMRTSMAHWHMGRIFTSEPALNESFVTADPTNRVFATLVDISGADQKCWVQLYNQVDALRPMPYYGTPQI